MLRLVSMAMRSLRARPSRTLLTLFGIVLGVAVILAISITNLSTLDSLIGMFSEAAGRANLVIVSSTDSGEGFPERLRGTVLGTAGVEQAVPSLQSRALLADKDPSKRESSFFGGSSTTLTLYGIDPVLDRKVREYKQVAGRFLSPALDVYEVVLVQNFADEQEIRLGDDVELLTGEGVATLRVVGFISKEGAGQANNGSFGVVPLKTAQEIFGRSEEIDQIDVVAEPKAASGEGLDALQVALQERLGTKYTVTYPAAQGKRAIQMLDVYQMGLSFFSVFAIFVGAFLIYNAFAMTVVERMREIGMLRAVGMTRRQIVRQILLEAAILGTAGSALGVAAGILVSGGLIRLMEAFLAQEVRQVHVPLNGLVTSLLVGMGITLLAAGMPAVQAGRVSPLEALRVRAKPQEGWLVRRAWPWGLALILVALPAYYVRVPVALEYWKSNLSVVALSIGATFLIPVTMVGWEWAMRPILRRLFGVEGWLGSGNLRRARQRTTLTVTALMVGIAMLFGIQALTRSFKHDVQKWIDGYIGGDLYVYSSQPLRSDFGDRLGAVDGVAAVTPMRLFQVKVLTPDGKEDRLTFLAVDPASYGQVTSFIFSAGWGEPERLMERLAAGDAVFVSTVIADKYGLEQGDKIRLETRRGQREFEVAAVVVDFTERGFVIEGSWKDLRRYFGLNDVSAFQVKLKAGQSAEQVQSRIDQLYGARRHLTIESNETIKAEAVRITAQTFGMFDVLAVIAVIVAALGVVNTMLMNVLERTQEIGMLRGVGMTRRQVGKMILAEAGIMGLVGGVMGVLLGLFQSRLFILGTNITQGYELNYVLPTQAIGIGFLIALLVSQLAALWPARRAASLRVVEAIQYE